MERQRITLLLVNNQLDALFSMNLFIYLFYMFQATQCSSSGESNCINTSSGICIDVCIDIIRFSWWWALGFSKHV